MALNPEDDQHLFQILAGTQGRRRGHAFEKNLAAQVNELDLRKIHWNRPTTGHLVTGHPAQEIVRFIAQKRHVTGIVRIRAAWLGGLKTAGDGDTITDDSGRTVTGSKTDVLLEFTHGEGTNRYGVSIKQCNNPSPTNAQIFCGSAVKFCETLRIAGIFVSTAAEDGLRMYCGDPGFRPIDMRSRADRRVNDERWFWEELQPAVREEWATILTVHQREITKIVLTRSPAYANDPFPPQFIMHKCTACEDEKHMELSLLDVDDLVTYSLMYCGFTTKLRRVTKGRFKEDPNHHEYPRFGFIQFQPIGNTQNKNELQMNLQAGYFNKIPATAEAVIRAPAP